MDVQDLKEVIACYPEWITDVDDMGRPTGYVYCAVCQGGGFTDRKRNRPPQHKPDCKRMEMENEQRCANIESLVHSS